MRKPLLLLLALGPALPARADEPKPPPPAAKALGADERAPDVFAEVLKEAGIPPGELGYRRKGTWSRFPDAPYKMPFFDDLLADPTATYEFTRTLGNVVEDLLTPEKLRAAPEKDKPETLFLLGTYLATDRRIGGFRGFGFHLLEAKVAEKDPLRAALGEAWKAGGKETPEIDVSKVPESLHVPLARLFLNLVDAHAWIERGLRNVTSEERKAVFDALRDLVDTTPDATKYFPVIEDVAREIDEYSLYYGCLKALAATQLARRELEAAKPKEGWPAFLFDADTPLGHVAVRAISPGGRELDPGFYPGFIDVRLTHSISAGLGAGSTGAGRSLSVMLLLEGADRVGDVDEGTVARGILGCGIVYSAGNTNSTFESNSWGLGAGMFGLGALIDEGGDDVYRIRSVGEGAGYFGVGLLLDAAGNDRYELLGGDGQGYGGPNGIGILADRSGNDTYYAEPRPEKAGTDRADYHSDKKIVSSDAQGCGMGRRGDLSDGHAWAGGLGALIDIDGDDTYEAGNFSQGCGYWFGTGLLYDGGGNDTYRSVYFSHASGAHFAVGCVVDEGGDDLHSLSDWPKVGLGPKAGAGLGFGWDVVNALLIDRAGNDRYEADIISEGCAEVRSNGWLIDEGGDDTYVLGEGEKGFGDIDIDERYSVPARVSPFAFHLSQLGLALDLGGTDRWLRRPKAGGDPVPDALAGDGKSWGHDGPRGPGGGYNVARGRDVVRGRIGWLDAWPRRVPPPPAAPVTSK